MWSGHDNTRCRKCDKRIGWVVDDVPYTRNHTVCQACYDAQERDFSQKLPVKVRVLWEVG